MKGVPDIKIQGNVIKIDRKDVVWSSDEYESEEEETNSKVQGDPSARGLGYVDISSVSCPMSA